MTLQPLPSEFPFIIFFFISVGQPLPILEGLKADKNTAFRNLQRGEKALRAELTLRVQPISGSSSSLMRKRGKQRVLHDL
jgi:hypothetical protein